MPIATAEREVDDVRSTVTLFFHENKDEHGNPSERVFGVSNSHILRKDTTVEYDFEGSMRTKLAKVKKDIGVLEAFYKEANSRWGDIARRNIGRVD